TDHGRTVRAASWKVAAAGPPAPRRAASRGQAAVFYAVGALGRGAEAAAAVGLVVLVVAREPCHAALALEGQDVGGDAVEEPAVVTDDDGAAREIDERILERAQRVDVEVVGGLVEEEEVPAAAQELRQVEAVPLAAREILHLLLLVGAGEVEGGGVGARVHLALADHDERAAAVGELLPHGALPDERFAALVDVGGGRAGSRCGPRPRVPPPPGPGRAAPRSARAAPCPSPGGRAAPCAPTRARARGRAGASRPPSPPARGAAPSARARRSSCPPTGCRSRGPAPGSSPRRCRGSSGRG